MVRNYPDELECDMAQFYGIHDYKNFKLSHISVLACGLPEQSRIIKKLTDKPYETDTYLLAHIVDRLSLIWWSKTTDAQENINRPKMMINMLNNVSEPTVYESMTIEDYEKTRAEIMGS